LSSQIISSETTVSHRSDSSLLLGPQTAVKSTTIFSEPSPNLFKNPVGLLLGRWLVLGRSVGKTPASLLVASDCAFYWSFNTYAANVTENLFTETAINTSLVNKANGSLTLPGAPNVPDSHIFSPEPYYVNGSSIATSDPRCEYIVNGPAHEALVNFFGMQSGFSLPGFASVKNKGEPSVSYEYSSGFMLYLLQAFQNIDSTESFQDIVNIAFQGAKMLSTVVRRQPISGNDVKTFIYDVVPGTPISSVAVFQTL
jgi:hypothetical protein